MVPRRRWICLAAIAASLACAGPAAALDPLPATAPTITSSPQPSPGTTRSLTYEFTGDPLETFECRLERPDATLVEDWTACDSGKTYTLDPAEPDGAYTFSVHAIDPLLGQSEDRTATYTLDTTGPVVTIDSGPAGEVNVLPVSFSFTSEPGATMRCRLTRGGATVSDWTDCTSPWAYGLSTQPDGNYEFAVEGTDTLGNPGPAATRAFTLKRPQPAAETNASPAASAEPPAPAGASAGAPALRQGVCINLFNGTPSADKINGSAFGDVLIGFAGDDRLDGLDGGDCVLGDQGNDRLDGGAGDDDVRGLAGNDVVRGADGNDNVLGGSGKDTLDGGNGDDQIGGGPGVDRFKGGAGKDAINAADGRRESVNCGPGRDSVTADRIDKLAGCESKKLRGRGRSTISH
jgi:hypothetical protein